MKGMDEGYERRVWIKRLDEVWWWRVWMKVTNEGYRIKSMEGMEGMKGLNEEYGWRVWMKYKQYRWGVVMKSMNEEYGWRMRIKCMNEGWRFDLQLSGLLSSICYILQWIVCVLASWFTDWIRQKQFISTIR